MEQRATVTGLELAELIDEKIEPLYRFALLLTGDPAAAQQALIDVCTACAPQIEAYRDAANRVAFIVAKLRARCLIASPGNTGSSPAIARQFQSMGEPERSALALFYLGIFPAQEIAALLHMSLEDLSGILERGREHLRAAAITS